MDSTTDRKDLLREHLRRRLQAIPPEVAHAAADRVAERVLSLPELGGDGAVLSCLSFGAEIDSWRLIDRLLAAGRPVYVPRVDRGDVRLHLHRYPCELQTLSFGLRQPRRGSPSLAPEAVDDTLGAVLVLGLGFDRRGYRLGYGGGYFDRFLSGRRLPAIGLAYDVQIVDELPKEPHDVPMTAVVTETQIYRRLGGKGNEGGARGNAEAP